MNDAAGGQFDVGQGFADGDEIALALGRQGDVAVYAQKELDPGSSLKTAGWVADRRLGDARSSSAAFEGLVAGGGLGRLRGGMQGRQAPRHGSAPAAQPAGAERKGS